MRNVVRRNMVFRQRVREDFARYSIYSDIGIKQILNKVNEVSR